MFLWGGGEVILGGYTLWLLSGIWLLLISVKIFKTNYIKHNIFILISTPMLITYFVGIVAFTSYMIR